MMTKKDFENMAYAIKHSPADRDLFIDMIVDLCADSNTGFDEKRFRIASGQVQSLCGCWVFTHDEGKPQSWNTGGLCHYAEGHPEGVDAS
tara:strand:- start:652 stop:921 length:270 start_codon:yes stop_codon:yes gene_type:complete